MSSWHPLPSFILVISRDTLLRGTLLPQLPRQAASQARGSIPLSVAEEPWVPVLAEASWPSNEVRLQWLHHWRMRSREGVKRGSGGDQARVHSLARV